MVAWGMEDKYLSPADAQSCAEVPKPEDPNPDAQK